MASSEPVKDDEREPRPTDGSPESSGQTVATIPAIPKGEHRLALDVLFGLLSNERRRLVLRYLAEIEAKANLSDLAEYVASIENDKPVDALTSSERKRVYICLYQSHLPKMDDANVIDYDKSRRTVKLRPEANELFSYLSIDTDGLNRTNSWLRRFVPAPLLALWDRLLG